MIPHNLFITHTHILAHTYTRVFSWTNVTKLWALMWPLSVFCYAMGISLRSTICPTDTERGAETGWLIDVYTREMLIKTKKCRQHYIQTTDCTAKKKKMITFADDTTTSGLIKENDLDRNCTTQQKVVDRLIWKGSCPAPCFIWLQLTCVDWLTPTLCCLFVSAVWQEPNSCALVEALKVCLKVR